MAICMVVDNPGQTREQTDRVLAALRATGPLPPTGALHVLGGAFDGGWRVISVWDSPESMERFFTTRLPQALREAGVDSQRLTRASFDVYKQSSDLAQQAVSA
jgi:hypothetical protein